MTAPSNRATKSLLLRVVMAYIGLGAAIVLAVGATLWQVRQQSADARLVNVSGAQRMLAQRMAMSGLDLLRSGGSDESKQTLQAALETFASAHQALASGSEAEGFPKPSPEGKQALQRVDEVWKPFQGDLRLLLDGATAEARLRQALDYADKENHALLDLAQRLVDKLRAQGADAATVDLAGSLRMLNQKVTRIMFEVERAEGGDRAVEEAREHAAELQGSLETFDRALARLASDVPQDSPARADFEALSKKWTPFRAQADTAAKEAEGHAARVSRAAKAASQSGELLKRADAATTLFQAEAEARVNQLIQILFGVVVAGLILTAIAAYAAARGLRPLRELERVASRIAEGDLREQVEVLSEDEVGRLAASFRAMVDELRTYTTRSGSISQNMSSATVQINSSVQEQSSVLTSQAAAIAEATSSLEELKANAVRNDGRAREVLSTTENTISGMRQVQDQVTEIATSIVALSEKVQQIGEILDSVSDIADQSNLLALNASIEASKAGEYGRGFEVVASEVRNLAQQSQKATLSIRSMLRDIQRAMNSAVMKTEEGTKRVERQSTDLQTATQSVEQIVYATREQSQAIEQITDAVASVSGSVSQSQASTSQIADATGGLVAQAEELRSALARFTV